MLLEPWMAPISICCLQSRCLAQLQWHSHNQHPGYLWLYHVISPYPEWLGRICCWCPDVSQFLFHQSQYSWWEVLPCRCRVPNLLHPTHSILWHMIPSFWMGLCTATVCTTYYFSLFATYILQAHHPRRIIQLTTCQGLEHHWESIRVVKWCFKILVIQPEYSMDVQARAFPALRAIHNCILERDAIEITDILPPSDDGIDVEDCGQFGTEYPGQAEKDRANARCDQIAESMWDDYQRVLWGRNL